MESPDTPPSRRELAEITDIILERSEEDDERLAEELEALDPHIRNELLVSDFLNAYQIFYYFFREPPGDLEMERLILQPASALAEGVVITEMEFLEVIFRMEDGRPVISVGDGDRILANFRGKDAYHRAIGFIDEVL